MKENNTKVKVILDTDIGTDIDDTWALGFMLCCPEIEPEMVLSATGNTVYRAKIAAKLLDSLGRSDIDIAVGKQTYEDTGPQAPWVENYELFQYSGNIFHNGIEHAAAKILGSDEPITLCCIGPLTNIAKLLEVAPEIAPRTHLVGMQGSLDFGLEGEPGKIAEWNIAQDIKAAQKTLSAPWKSISLTPLDTCGRVRLRGEFYEKLDENRNPLIKLIMENYRIWNTLTQYNDDKVESSVLFDTVAIYMCYADELIEFENIRVSIDDDGFINESEDGVMVRFARSWKDIDKFKNLLTDRLLAYQTGAVQLV